MQVLSYRESRVPADLREQVRRMQNQAWPPDESATDGGDDGHDSALRPLSMLLVDDGAVLASLDILFKEIVHAGRRWNACGLSTVVTRQDVRGRGYGRRLVVTAREALPSLAVDLALFTCDRNLQGFYEGAGFHILPGTVLIGGTPEQPFPSDQPGFDKIALAALVSPAARAGRALFEHAHIELYPGEIDKLW